MSLLENQSDLTSESKKIRPVILNVSKKILNRESIFRNIADAQLDLDSIKKKPNSKLTEEQIKSSHIYNKLIERIQNLEEEAQSQAHEHVKNIKILNKMIVLNKQKIHETKYNVWELKNQIIQLEEELKNEEYLEQDQDYDQYYGDGNLQDQENSDQDDNESLAGQSQAEYYQNIYPNCSIKEMITTQKDKSQSDSRNSNFSVPFSQHKSQF